MADIANSLRGWSATAGSNQPTDSTTIGSGLDDNLRTLQAVVRQFLASQGTNIASAATMDLSTMDGYCASVTGSTTVTGLGTEAAGISYWLEFASTPVIKYNAASLILPGAADITAVAGDIMRFTSEGSGIWRCTQYLPFSYNGTGQFVRTASPTLTGVPAAPTAAAGTSTTQLATTAFVTTISSPTVQVYTTTGSNSWAKPANLKHIIVECLGAGGGGGGNAGQGAGGGGAGGYTSKLILASSVAASVTATVGAAGSLGAPGSTAGTAGGLSAFQGHCTATGGAGGAVNQAGGAGGAGVNGNINGTGQSGGSGVTAVFGGYGGSTRLGGGGSNSEGTGNAATGKGSGGGGGFSATGGAAADGIVIVWEYYT